MAAPQVVELAVHAVISSSASSRMPRSPAPPPVARPPGRQRSTVASAGAGVQSGPLDLDHHDSPPTSTPRGLADRRRRQGLEVEGGEDLLDGRPSSSSTAAHWSGDGPDVRAQMGELVDHPRQQSLRVEAIWPNFTNIPPTPRGQAQRWPNSWSTRPTPSGTGPASPLRRAARRTSIDGTPVPGSATERTGCSHLRRACRPEMGAPGTGLGDDQEDHGGEDAEQDDRA